MKAVLALCIICCFAFGCNNQSTIPENMNTSINWNDTTIFNNVGFWHNEVMIPTYDSLLAMDSINFYNLCADDDICYEYITSRVWYTLNNIYEFQLVEIDTSGARSDFNEYYKIAWNNPSVSSILLYLDSILQFKNAPQFYIETATSICDLMQQIHYEEELDAFMYNIVNSTSYTDEEKIYTRILTSVAKESRTFWINEGFAKVKTKSAQGIFAFVAAFDLVGAAASTYRDLDNGQKDGWKIAKNAAVTGAVSSLGVFVSKKYGGTKPAIG